MTKFERIHAFIRIDRAGMPYLMAGAKLKVSQVSLESQEHRSYLGRNQLETIL